MMITNDRKKKEKKLFLRMSRLIALPGQVDVEQLKVTPKERKKEFRKKKNQIHTTSHTV